MEVRQLEIEQKRYVQNQNDIIQTIDKAKKTYVKDYSILRDEHNRNFVHRNTVMETVRLLGVRRQDSKNSKR